MILANLKYFNKLDLANVWLNSLDKITSLNQRTSGSDSKQRWLIDHLLGIKSSSEKKQ